MPVVRPTRIGQESLVLPSLLMTATSQGRFTAPPHIQAIEDYILAAVIKGDQLLTIEAPVRHGKSFYVDWHLPLWYLGQFPHTNVGIASYEHRFAASWGQRTRDSMIEFGANFGVAVNPEVQSREWWETMHKGSMRSMGVGGAITGKGFNLFIVDDPIKNAAEADSEVYRNAHWDWLQSTVLTRLEPGAVCIVMMARWHEDDLIGRIHREMPNEWQRLRLPAIAEADDPLGRPEGEPLWPRRYGVQNLARRKRRVGAYYFNALYQQRPSPPQGAIFQRQWWKRYTVLPTLEQKAWSWDMSFKDADESSYVVGQLWGRAGADFYLIHQVRARMDFPSTKAALRAAHADTRWGSVPLVLVEDKANGPAIIADLRHEIPGLVAVQTGSDSKVGRAQAISPYVESGNVYLPERDENLHEPLDADWVPAFIDECASFPKGAHDDQVDACSQGISQLAKRMGAMVVTPMGDLPRPVRR